MPDHRSLSDHRRPSAIDPAVPPECSSGDFTYRYSGLPGVDEGRSCRPECHRPAGGPPERDHCAVCGGDYCAALASRASHDCENITDPHGEGGPVG